MQNEKEKAFMSLVQSNKGVIYGVIYKFTDDPEDVKDLYQSIMEELWKSLDSFKGKSKFSTWLYCVSRNVVRDIFLKRKMKTTSFIEDLLHVPDTQYDDLIDERLTQLKKLCDSLNPTDKKIIDMHWEGVGNDEMAEELGVIPLTMRVKSKRAKDNLKKLFLKNKKYL